MAPELLKMSGKMLIALNAAMWIAASAEPESVLPRAQEAFRALVEGLLARPVKAGQP